METNQAVFAVEQQVAEPKAGYPRRFVGVMAEYGAAVLRDWLKQNQAPAEIVELAEGLEILQAALQDEQGGTVGGGQFSLVGDAIARIGRGMHFTGAEMTAPGGTVII